MKLCYHSQHLVDAVTAWTGDQAALQRLFSGCNSNLTLFFFLVREHTYMHALRRYCFRMHVLGPCQRRLPTLTRVLVSCSTCECLTTPSRTCCSTWWRRSGSWICPSCSFQCTGVCRTLNYSPSSSRSLAKGSSKLPWRPGLGSSPEGLTQVTYAPGAKHLLNICKTPHLPRLPKLKERGWQNEKMLIHCNLSQNSVKQSGLLPLVLKPKKGNMLGPKCDFNLSLSIHWFVFGDIDKQIQTLNFRLLWIKISISFPLSC